MTRKPKPQIELACQALCRFHGLPEDTKFEGRPIWESYIPEATAVMEALGLDVLSEGQSTASPQH